jgi:hypothetical protein
MTNQRKQLHQLQKYGCISLTNAAAVSDTKTNGYFSQFSSNINKTKNKGMFYQFEPRIRECLLTVAIDDAPQTVSINRDALDNQRDAKRKKEEMIEKKSLEKAQESLVEASYYWDMCFSDVCWKGKQSIVGKILALLKSELAKLEAQKEKDPNASAWIGMEAICNYVVARRCEEICGRAGYTFEIDYQGRKESDASN